MNAAKIRRSSRYGRVATVKQCDCNMCLDFPHAYRQWLVRWPDGPIYQACMSWDHAMKVVEKIAGSSSYYGRFGQK